VKPVECVCTFKGRGYTLFDFTRSSSPYPDTATFSSLGPHILVLQMGNVDMGRKEAEDCEVMRERKKSGTETKIWQKNPKATITFPTKSDAEMAKMAKMGA